VRSGTPLRTALARCPDAVFLPVDRETYEDVSAQVMATLRSFDAVVEVLGWDEAFMGVETGDPQAYARGVQDAVRVATGLECSVGIGQNKLQAKIATDYGKPAGTFEITDATWFTVLGAKPPDALWGIGGKTAQKLQELGIRTVTELATADPQAMAQRFGPSTGPWLVRLARGRDRSPVTAEPYVNRGRSRETTFQQDLDDWDRVRAEVVTLAGRVVDDVVAEGRPVVRVVVKVRYRPFFTSTHGRALAEPTQDAAAIEAAALAALDMFEDRQRPVRLLGVRAEMTPPPA
jgi:nucleotidyltransferase/DNA polymerase involved in DNA repair